MFAKGTEMPKIGIKSLKQAAGKTSAVFSAIMTSVSHQTEIYLGSSWH